MRENHISLLIKCDAVSWGTNDSFWFDIY